MTRAILANWFDLPPEHEAAFDAWHNRQHVIERVSIPGFDQGRRLESIDVPAPPGHGYLVTYDTTALSVLASPAYGERLDNPTDWTQKVVPVIRNLTRTVCEVTQERGSGTGGYVRTIRLPGLAGELAAPGTDIGEALDAAYACESVTSVQLCRPDTDVTHFKDRTREGRATDTVRREEYPWMVIVEACRAATLDAATEALRAAFARRWPQAKLEFVCHSYVQVFSMRADQAPRQ